MTKYIIGIVVLIVVGAGVYMWQNKGSEVKTEVQSSDQVTGAVAWQFNLDESGEMPKTQINIVSDGKKYDVGTYTGTCVEMTPDQNDVELKTSVTYAQCWYAGAGYQIAVFETSDELSVKSRTIEEESVTPQPFKLLFDLP